MIKLVIFDLDGTLLNTIADLANSTNYALMECGFPTHEDSAYNQFVGNGINVLFERALPEGEKTPENVLRVRKVFIPHYDKHNACSSTPYPGIPELLDALKAKGILLAVASNKYQSATEKLVEYYFPDIPFAAVLGQREGIPAKPDPTIVREILEITGVSNEETLYVGDSGVDMEIVIRSQVIGAGVSWGFRTVGELEAFTPKYIVDSADEILKIVDDSAN